MTAERPDFAAERERMVETQLAGRGIRDERVLEAMGSVPREAFVPEAERAMAYYDCPLGIGEGQTISQPYMVALMSESLHLQGPERVLEIGTGSGYQAAVLARLAAHVYTVERVPELGERARTLLCDELGYGNISFAVHDGTLGWEEEAPFDHIIVTAGAPREPERLLDQLGVGGEAVAPVGGRYGQELMHYRRARPGKLKKARLCGCIFVPLVGRDGW